MKHLFLAALTVLVFSSCTVPPLQSRIAKHGGMYSSLSPEHRALVARGDITKGMNKDAVFLAWGTPSRVYQAEKKGVAKERWVYTRYRSAHGSHMSYGLAYSTLPRYRRWGYHECIYYGMPQTVYIPEKMAEVLFVGDQVESWERKK